MSGVAVHWWDRHLACPWPRSGLRRLPHLGLLFFLAAAYAAQPPFTLDQILGYSFPTDLTAAPAGGKVAWVSNTRGVRNILVAEPPGYLARPITAYSADDGQEISDLAWTPDASAIVYTRGSEPGRETQSANPALNPHGSSRNVWIVRLDGSAPREIGPGSGAVVSPKGDRVVFLQGGKLWWAALDGKAAFAPVFDDRGQCSRPVWSPDGTRIAFTSARGDHSFIGVYDFAASTLRYLDPSTDFDDYPVWSPDGGRVAFVRVPSSGLRPVREAHREGEPWSIRIASATTGQGQEIWRAHAGPGSVFREMDARQQLLWAAGDRLIFPWEGDGWLHLYSLPVAGGPATLLTPGDFEVQDAVLTPGGREVLFASNWDDIDRRHLAKVAVEGGPMRRLTESHGIEWSPAPASDGLSIAFLRSDAHRPAAPWILGSKTQHPMDPHALPPDFPLAHMVIPQQVVFPSTDGLQIHGQLFLPPHPTGKLPAIVFFHGGPQRQMLLGWHSMYYYSNAYALNQYLANAGFAVLSINFRSGIGYGLNFREALHFGASGASDFNDVLAAAQYLRGRPDIDAARIGAWGGSYGGYLTAMALAKASDIFKAGADFHGVHDWAMELGIPATAPDYKMAWDSSPLAFVKGWRSPVLLIQGDDDPDVMFANTVILADALRKQGVKVEELVLPDEVHDFLLYRSWRESYAAAAGFLQRQLQ